MKLKVAVKLKTTKGHYGASDSRIILNLLPSRKPLLVTKLAGLPCLNMAPRLATLDYRPDHEGEVKYNKHNDCYEEAFFNLNLRFIGVYRVYELLKESACCNEQ